MSPDIPYQGFTHRALSCTDFSSSKIRHASTIAAFISAIAPRLATIVAWYTEYCEEHPVFDNYSAGRRDVQRLMKLFSMVREQERRMVLSAGDVGDDASGSGQNSEDDKWKRERIGWI
jgi:hypothetical protein